VPTIVHSLSRIGLLPNSSAENRRLAVDLAELILIWEKRRIDVLRSTSSSTSTNEAENQPATKPDGTPTNQTCCASLISNCVAMELEDVMEVSSAAEASPVETTKGKKDETPLKSPTSNNVHNYQLSPALTEMIANFLIRVAATTNEARDQVSLQFLFLCTIWMFQLSA